MSWLCFWALNLSTTQMHFACSMCLFTLSRRANHNRGSCYRYLLVLPKHAVHADGTDNVVHAGLREVDK